MHIISIALALINMVDANNKQEEIKIPEKMTPGTERPVHFEREKTGAFQTQPEKREISPDDKIVSAELRREIEMMELDDKTKAEAKKKAEKIEFLDEKEKIEHLLEVAREKGVVFAIQVVKKMNDPYLLDILHDVLAQEGFYKKIVQTTDDDKNKKDDDSKNKKNKAPLIPK